jgi:hypothetical protein
MIPVHAIEEYGSEGVTPLVLKPGKRWGWKVRFMLLVGEYDCFGTGVETLRRKIFS